MDSTISTNTNHTTMSGIEGETRGKGGRRIANPVIYEEVDDHIEGIVVSKGQSVRFKIDKDDLEKVQSRHWYATVNGQYIGSHITMNGVRKILYLHNFVMNKLTFEGKGQLESVDHMNRDGMDNRKSNLRLVSQTLQNINQKKKPRKAEMPSHYSISTTDLPKHVCYRPPCGYHADGFSVEFRKNGKRVYQAHIRSRTLTIEEKLTKIKSLLEKGYGMYPEYRPSSEPPASVSQDTELHPCVPLGHVESTLE